MKDLQAADRFHIWMRGWKTGACVRAKDPAFLEHANPEVPKLYEEAYQAGLDSRSLAAANAITRFGYEPSILRTQAGRNS